MPCEIPFGPGVADNALNLSGGDVESGDQGLSAVALVFELAAFDLARRFPGVEATSIER